MNVVHLNTSDFGGAAVAAIQLHQALLEKGVGSDLLTLTWTRNDVQRHHLVESFALNGSPTWNRMRYKIRRGLERTGLVQDRSNSPGNRMLRPDRKDHEIFSFPFSWFSILDHPLVQQADLIHLHWVGYGMIDHCDFFGRCSKPIVWTLHDMNPFTAGSHHTDEDESYRDGPDSSPQLKDPRKAQLLWKYKYDAVRQVPAEKLRLVAPSRWLADRAMASAMFKGRSCTVIPNGFDSRIFRPKDKVEARKELGLPVDKRIILFNALDVANPRKGMQHLLAALRTMSTPDVQLVSVGHRGTLPQQEAIEFGFVQDPSRLATLYAAADVFVLPSVAENLPNTIAEAHLCGTPVVAFAVGGIPEQVHAGNGRLAPLKDEVGLRHAVDEVLSLTWDRDGIAREAAARYGRDRVAEAYLRQYSM